MKEIKETQLDSWHCFWVAFILRLFIEPLRVALEPFGCYWEPNHVFGRYEDRFLARWVFHHGTHLFWIELRLVERCGYLSDGLRSRMRRRWSFLSGRHLRRRSGKSTFKPAAHHSRSFPVSFSKSSALPRN